MTKHLLFGALALILLVQTPTLFAFECNSLDPANYDTCNEIMNSELTEEEKELLASNLEYQSKFFPDHYYVYQRNTNLLVDNSPEGIQEHSGQFVREAWVAVFTAMPSIIYNNNLYCPRTTEILTGYNYDLSIPSNYQSSRYPYTNGGDCKRTYSLIQNTAENRVYANNNYQGSGRLVSANINSDSEIKAVYDIDVAVDVDHYKWEKKCCKRRNGRCKRYCYTCRYRYDETQGDDIRIEDSIDVKFYDNNLFADLEIVNSYGGTTSVSPNFSNSIEVNFENSEYEFNEYTYSINYSKAPYYIYTLEAEDYNKEKSSNILRNGANLLIKNINLCSIKAFDFFNIIEKSCGLNGEDFYFYIKTDKLKYKPNETIHVEIIPDDILVEVTYANKTKEVKGGVNLDADPAYNKITASYGISNSERIIFIQGEERFGTVMNLSIFGFLNYFLYVSLRKYFGGFI